ncbi:unnamed protein product [Macrosiphum euphorbiae]|uniref:Ubiquitin-like protease family profile domain-containing protein n=1 Tax=Macrosiphum euphorbiae TaxID=13131 RepID=A0AAV0WVH0_9HEMI|nr:unnamed protein product [Macrosiphum euphorbiae]
MAGYTNEFFKYWYNSSIIEEYLTILTNENPASHFFSVDFLKKYCEERLNGIIRWVKKPILDMDSLLFPINVGNHWILIVVFLNSKMVVCYDGKHRNHQYMLSIIKTFMTDWEKYSSVQLLTWRTLHGITPTQHNNDDCGPWILAVAKCVALVEPICFTEKDMPQIRIQQYQNIMSNTIQSATPPPRTTQSDTIQSTTPPPGHIIHTYNHYTATQVNTIQPKTSHIKHNQYRGNDQTDNHHHNNEHHTWYTYGNHHYRRAHHSNPTHNHSHDTSTDDTTPNQFHKSQNKERTPRKQTH